jgi:hypothetical protein
MTNGWKNNRRKPMIIFNRVLSVEYRLGVGFDLEFPDSRPVWVYNTNTGNTETMPFQGVILHLPLCLVSFGRVYEEVYE